MFFSFYSQIDTNQDFPKMWNWWNLTKVNKRKSTHPEEEREEQKREDQETTPITTKAQIKVKKKSNLGLKPLNSCVKKQIWQGDGWKLEKTPSLQEVSLSIMVPFFKQK